MLIYLPEHLKRTYASIRFFFSTLALAGIAQLVKSYGLAFARQLVQFQIVPLLKKNGTQTLAILLPKLDGYFGVQVKGIGKWLGYVRRRRRCG